jgi:hypothetical protein
VAAGDLAVEHLGDVDAGFAHQVAAQLDDDLGLGHLLAGFGGDGGEVGADARQVEVLLAGK